MLLYSQIQKSCSISVLLKPDNFKICGSQGIAKVEKSYPYAFPTCILKVIDAFSPWVRISSCSVATPISEFPGVTTAKNLHDCLKKNEV